MKKLWLFFSGILGLFSASGQSAAEWNRQARLKLAEANYKAALPLLQKAAQAGSAESQYYLGKMLLEGKGVAANSSLAHGWLVKSARQGWRAAQAVVANNFSTGRGVQQNLLQAFQWNLACARKNDLECMFSTIASYEQGLGTSANADSIVAWETRVALLSLPYFSADKASLLGQPVADHSKSELVSRMRLQLAQRYRDGRGVATDSVRSLAWYLLGIEAREYLTGTAQLQVHEEYAELAAALSGNDHQEALRMAAAWLQKPLNRTAL